MVTKIESFSVAKTTSVWLAAALTANGVRYHPLWPSGVKREGKRATFQFADEGHDGSSTFAMMHAWDNPGTASAELDKAIDRLANHTDPVVRQTAEEIKRLRPADHMEFMHAGFKNAPVLAREPGKKLVNLGPVGRYREVTIEEEPSEATKRSLRL